MHKPNWYINLTLVALSIGMSEGSFAPGRAQSGSEVFDRSKVQPMLVSQIFQPPDTQAPKDTMGGASRGDRTFNPPEDQAPKDTTGAASRGEEFQPPLVGVPGRREGAGTRGDLTTLVGLTPPTKYGQTVVGRPTFFVYVPPQAVENEKEVFFSLQDEKQNPHYKARVEISSKGGIVSFQLPQSAPELEVGKQYKWYFIVVEKGQRLQADTTGVTGWIKRVEPTAELMRQQASGVSLELALSYGKAGIWYDTITTLAQLKEAQPENSTLAERWEELLGEIGLKAIASQPLVEIDLTTARSASSL